MKTSSRLDYKLLKRNTIGICAGLSLILGTAQTRAAVDYWDPQGTTGSNPYTGSMSGTWENALWSTNGSSGGGNVLSWVEGDAACFAVHSGGTTPAFTVTMNANHTVAGFFNGPLSPDPCTVTIAGTGVITLPANTFQGCDVTSDAGDPGVLTIAVPIAGTGSFGDGLCAEGTGMVNLNGINTFSDGSYLGYSGASFTGTWGFTNADPTQPGICTSFGTGGIYLSNCYGTLAVEGTSAVTVTNSVYHVMPVSFATFATLNINGNPAGVTFSGPWALSGSTFSKSTVLSAINIGSVGAANNLVTISGVMSGTNGFTKSGIGILALSGANTYSGNTLITNGTLALTGSGSINSSPLIMITTNATLDVSGVTGGTFTLSSSTTLNANGVGATAGTSSATINGPAGGTVNLGSQPINLTFTPTSPSGDTTHPALNISQGTLAIGGNSFTVNNSTTGMPLGAGTYTLIQQASGNVTDGGGYSVTVTGNGLAAGATASIQVSGGAVNLVVTGGSPVPFFSNLAATSSTVYGATSVTLSGTVSAPGPIYPASGETVNVTIDGNAQTTTIDDSTGDFSINYNPHSIPVGTYTVNYGYGGDGSLNGDTNVATTYTVTKAPLSVTPTAQSTTYGTSLLTGDTQFTSSGLQNGETIGSVSMAVTATPPYSTNTPVGTYTDAFTPSAATGGTFNANNYTITYNPASVGLTVNAKALTITASATSKPFGSAPVGVLTGQTAFAESGLVNGQSTSSLTVTLTYNGTAANSPVSGSPYTITPSAAVEASGKTNFNPANYTITYDNGNLTITNLSVRLTGAQPYGSAWVEANSLTVSNAIAGDNVNVVLGLGLLASANPGVQTIASPATLVLGNAGDQGSGTGTGAGAQFNAPTGITVDANDNVYVADTANNRIDKINSVGVETVLGFTGLTDPSGVAVDSSGDVYVTDPILNEVVVLPSSGTQSNLPITGLNYPVGLAVDVSGDVFVADTLNSRIVEYAANGVQSTLPFSGVTTLFLPSGVAVDTNGDVYVANAGSNNIVELSATGVQTVLPFSGLNFATSVAVDTSSNIYVVNYGGANVKKLTSGTVSTPAFTSLANPAGIAVDANGNLFVSDTAHDRIAEFSGSTSSTFAGVIGAPNYTITGAGGTVTNTDTPVFSNLSSHSVNYGASVTLTGTLSGPGPTYPASGTVITATVDGIQGSGAISGSSGAFSINFNSTGIPASATPYTVTYSSAKAGAFFPASDSSTTLTVNQATVTITSGLTVNPVTYGSLNGLGAATLSSNNVVLAGVIAQDAGNVELDTNGYTATFTETNANPDVPVTVSGLTLTGSAAANYSLVQPSLTGTINPATLTYTANPATRTYGAPNPAFSGTVSGFVDGETQSSATTGTLVFSSPAPLDSPAGSYAIDGSGLSAANYTFVQATANATALTVTAEGSGIDFWVGGNANTNWSNPSNWSLDQFPGSATTVLFTTAGAASGSPYAAFGQGFGGITTPGNFNSIVDSGFGGTISSLIISNVNAANNWQNILISGGGALNITGSNGLTIGNGEANIDFGDAATPTATIGGSLATLSVNNTNARVWVTEGSTAKNACAFLDLSGLGYFDATVSQFWVAVSDTLTDVNYPGGVMYLAATNNITAEYSTTASETSGTAGAAAFVVGDTSSSNGTNSYLYLGQNNTITADTIFTAREKLNAATIAFNPNLPNLNSPIDPPTVTFKGYSANAVSIFSVGDGTATSGTASCNGTDNFLGGVINATIATLNVGRAGSNSSGAGDCIGVLSFSAGTITAQTCYLGYQPTANTAGKEGTGTINVSTNEGIGASGVLSITGSLIIGQNGTPTNATGTLNVTNGTVMANSIVCGATASNSIINLMGGALYLTNELGAPGAGLSALTLSNTTIHLNLNGIGSAPLTNIVASNITVMPDTTATIVFDSIANVSSTPFDGGTLTFPLISYTGADPIAGLQLGSLPANYTSGSLIDNTDAKRIDLQVTYTPPALLVWSGTVNSDWDLTTLNWDGGTAAYANPDLVQFDDTAATGNVEVAATVSPTTILVTNNTLNYVFSTGGGSMTGPATLYKEGTATLTYTDSGDDFIGGIVAGQGLLVLDQPETLPGTLTIDSGANVQAGNNDANGNLPAGNVVNNGGLTFDRTDNPTVANLISGSGSVTNNGTGTLTLAVANTFSGGLTLNSGTLLCASTGSGTTPLGGVAKNVGATTASNVVVNAGATLIGLGSDAFGTYPNVAPGTIYILGGTVTDTNTSNYRITLPNLTFMGGVLTRTTGNSGSSGEYSFNGAGSPAVITTLPATSTAQIIPGSLSLQQNNQTTGATIFNVAQGTVTGGATPGVDLFISALMENYSSETAGIVKTGAGTMELTAANTFSGGVNNNAGTLIISAGGSVNSAGALTNNGNFVYNSSSAQTLGGIVSGSGTLTQDGAGTLTLTAVNSFSGNTIINGGTLALTGTGSLADSSMTINSGGTLDVSGLTSTSYTMGGTSFTASGDAAATIKGAAGGTVSLGTMPVTLNYNGSAPALTVSQGTLVFDGNALIINGPPLADGDYSGIISGNVSGTIGSVSGTAIGAGMSGSFTISGGTLTLIVVNTTTTTLSGGAPTPYGSPLSITATVSPAVPDGESIVFATNGTAFSTNSTSGSAATLTSSTLAAGTYSVTAMYVGDSTNAASTSQPSSQVVTPVTLTPTVRVESSKPYDGTTTATIAARSLSGYVAGDNSSAANLGSSGVANYADPNVGTAKTVTITGLALSGPKAGDYVLSSTTASTTANITAAGVTITSGVVANNKVYDGTNTATLSLSNAVVLAGLIGSDASSVTLLTNGYEAVFTNSNVGTNIPVTVTDLTLTGGDYTNYSLTQPTLSADITPATLTYLATDTNLNYGSTTTNFAGTVTGFVGADTLSSATAGTLEFTGTNTPTTPVGSYPITGSGLTASNYVFVQAAGNATALTITSSIPVSLSVSISATQLTISWPPAYVGYTLETNSSDISNPADWYPYTGSTTASSEVITIDPTQTNVFFRLVGP